MLENEREITEVAQKHFEKRGKDKIRAVIIKDSLHLADMYVSEPVLDALAEPGMVEIVEPAKELVFDSEGKTVVDL